MPTTLQTVTISFPEISLHPSAGHKLRGYFGNLFKEHSPLLHNHYASGGHIYRYPLVQYKVVQHTPMLLGLGEGAQLLVELFLQMAELELDGRAFPVRQKNIRSARFPVGVATDLFEYRFETLWMALNQQNHREYLQKNDTERAQMLERVLRGNMLAFLKGADHFENQQVLVKAHLQQEHTQFKDQKMLAFHGTFTTNLQLPPLVGLGKSVSRGFGAISPADRPVPV